MTAGASAPRPRPGPFLALLAVAALGVVAACGEEHTSTSPTADASALDAALRDPVPAAAPFEGLGVVEVLVGDEILSVVVADDAESRREGLRGRTDPDPYDGMLFVHVQDTSSAFTMRGVDAPLELAFYDAAGERRGGHEMEPCPDGRDCPSYPPEVPWRYALETPPGGLPDGALRAPRARSP